MENESPLPEAPLSPREISFKKAMGYGWAGLLLGAIFLVDGIFIGVVFQFVTLGTLPAFVTLGLPIALAVSGLLVLTLALGRISKRRRLLERGRAIQGKILSCEPKKRWNPPPWVLTFEALDPMSAQPIQGDRWFFPTTWSSQPPKAGQTCLVVVEEGMSQRVELLAVEGWQAWSD